MKQIKALEHPYPYTKTYLSFKDVRLNLKIADYFSDQVKSLCRSTSESESPYTHFINNADRIYSEANGNPELMNQIILNEVDECDLVVDMNMDAIMEIMNQYKPKSILDPNAMWGNRLVASLIYKISYTGINSNKLMHYHYEELIQIGGSLGISRMIETTFEKAEINGNFDMIFTIMPEIPPRDLYALLQKSWNHLQVRGIMCLYFPNTGLASRAINYMKSQYDATDHKRVEFGSENKIFVHIWTKTESYIDEYNPILLERYLFKMSISSLYDRALPRYFKTLPKELYYVAKGDDYTAIRLGKNIPSHQKLNVYISNQANELSTELNQIENKVTSIIYDSSYDLVVNKVKEIQRKNNVLSYGLNNAEFEYILTVILLRDLPYTPHRGIVLKPKRIWINLSKSTEVILRALGHIWDHTIFLVWSRDNYNKKELPESLQRRVMVYNFDDSKLSLATIKKRYGYFDDYIMEG